MLHPLNMTLDAVQILVVDDDPSMTRLLEVMIEKCFGDKAYVETVNDPRQAEATLETEVVDLLLTDLEMPDINGLQLLQCAKRRNAWTQVIVITGHSSREALTAAMELGASDYLVKPIEMGALKETLGEAYARLQRWRKSLAYTLAHKALQE
jgi:DNA-binding NtrC family response regulator